MSTNTYIAICDIYHDLPKGTQSASISKYNPSVLNPQFLGITVVRIVVDANTNKYQITMIAKNSSFTFAVTIDDSKQQIVWENIPFNVETTSPDTDLYTIQITFTKDTTVLTPYQDFDPGDSYTIALEGSCQNTSGIDVSVTRDARFSLYVILSGSGIIAADSTCTGCPCLVTDTNNTISVPIISILGQTTIDGSDIGNAIFTICDQFTYYKKHPLFNSKCAIYTINPLEVKETRFSKCCPKIVTVVKGKGNTLQEKLMYIYSNLGSIIGPSFLQFYNNIFIYGMAKYILSRILYGNFNIKYLLGKYNDKFLKDLGNSGFCNLLRIFEDPNSPIFGYNKFFKYGKKKNYKI